MAAAFSLVRYLLEGIYVAAGVQQLRPSYRYHEQEDIWRWDTVSWFQRTMNMRWDFCGLSCELHFNMWSLPKKMSRMNLTMNL